MPHKQGWQWRKYYFCNFEDRLLNDFGIYRAGPEMCHIKNRPKGDKVQAVEIEDWPPSDHFFVKSDTGNQFLGSKYI